MSYSRPHLPPHDPGEEQVAKKNAEVGALRAHIAELEAGLAATARWLEENQPDVFRRGLWDSISTPSAQALARLVEAVGVEYESPHLTSFVCEKCARDEVLAIALESHEATMEAYGAYLAARSGRGEGE